MNKWFVPVRGMRIDETLGRFDTELDCAAEAEHVLACLGEHFCLLLAMFRLMFHVLVTSTVSQ